MARVGLLLWGEGENSCKNLNLSNTSVSVNETRPVVYLAYKYYD